MTGARTACPICGLIEDDPDRIYRHLLVGHRKRAVAKALLETGAAREETVVPGPRGPHRPRSK